MCFKFSLNLFWDVLPVWLCLSLSSAKEAAAHPGEATGGSPFAYFDEELFF